jgi:hypothetical protein
MIERERERERERGGGEIMNRLENIVGLELTLRKGIESYIIKFNIAI